ncbi:MAG: ATP-binding cassette domain-containing protein [bacterium]
MKEEVIIRFEDVSFKFITPAGEDKVILDDTSFSVRNNAKVTIMGQNGAGKSTIFKLLTNELKPESGEINIKLGAKIGMAQQMIPREQLDFSVLEYFSQAFSEVKFGIERNIKDALRIVNLDVPLERRIRELSGGQKARILLAYALVQDPDILLLDEPTNNLDQTGIEHLTEFLIMYPKTCLVISHDADFLNCFTEGVLNLDINTHKVEQFVGNYYDVLEEIAAQIERERLQNARINKSIVDRFKKVNKLGGKSIAMRRLARRVREDIAEDREELVDIRQEDKTIPDFTIPYQHYPAPLIKIHSVSMLKNGNPLTKEFKLDLIRGRKLIIKGPNGIGKSTLLKAMLWGQGAHIDSEVRVGYYSQDFSELNFENTGLQALQEVAVDTKPEYMYAAAGRFMLTGKILQHQVGDLSEGQKGLLCYARFMVQEPGLLILDEPTNHINFRHIPVIAKAINEYKGAVILVSHVPDFVSVVRIDAELDLEKLSREK